MKFPLVLRDYKVRTFVTGVTVSSVTEVSFSFHISLVKERGFYKKYDFMLLFYERTVSDRYKKEHALADVETSFDSHHRAFDPRIPEDIEEVFWAGKAEVAGKNAF
jgi:hypothetical protein